MKSLSQGLIQKWYGRKFINEDRGLKVKPGRGQSQALRTCGRAEYFSMSNEALKGLGMEVT